MYILYLCVWSHSTAQFGVMQHAIDIQQHIYMYIYICALVTHYEIHLSACPDKSFATQRYIHTCIYTYIYAL